MCYSAGRLLSSLNNLITEVVHLHGSRQVYFLTPSNQSYFIVDRSTPPMQRKILLLFLLRNGTLGVGVFIIVIKLRSIVEDSSELAVSVVLVVNVAH